MPEADRGSAGRSPARDISSRSASRSFVGCATSISSSARRRPRSSACTNPACPPMSGSYAAAMPRRILFLTGHLAAGRLRKVLAEMTAVDFAWETRDIGIQVAALMTAELIRRRLPREAIAADRIVVPGHCAGDLASLSDEL